MARQRDHRAEYQRRLKLKAERIERDREAWERSFVEQYTLMAFQRLPMRFNPRMLVQVNVNDCEGHGG